MVGGCQHQACAEVRCKGVKGGKKRYHREALKRTGYGITDTQSGKKRCSRGCAAVAAAASASLRQLVLLCYNQTAIDSIDTWVQGGRGWGVVSGWGDASDRSKGDE